MIARQTRSTWLKAKYEENHAKETKEVGASALALSVDNVGLQPLKKALAPSGTAIPGCALTTTIAVPDKSVTDQPC